MAIRLNRRSFLQGLCGATVGLPVLECMLDGHGVAFAQTGGTLPRRYAYLFAGMASGGDGWTRTTGRLDGRSIDEEGHFIAPLTTGADYVLTTPLEPLAGVRDLVTVVSNTRIPFNPSNNVDAPVPAGGAYRAFHGGAAGPLLSGMRSTSSSFRANGITPDRALARMHATANGGTASDYSLVYRAQPAWYLSNSDFYGRQYLSYDGPGNAVGAQDSPEVAYSALFGGFVPPTGNDAETARFNFRQRARRSVLDVITGKRQSLLGRVGVADRARLERHFDEIRDLENRLQQLPPEVGGECIRPPAPGADPAMGANGTSSGSINSTTGYSNEFARARLFADFIHMAFTCDLARSATLMITTFQCHMNAYPITEGRLAKYISTGYTGGVLADLHEMGHNGDPRNRGQVAMSVGLQWHIEHYAYLVEKLRDTPEGDGNVLDNCAIVFSPEAGHGAGLDSGGDSDGETHTVERIPLLIAGRAGGLSPGRHVDAMANYHPVNVQLSAMRACGYQAETLGEVSGIMPELFV